MTKYWGPIKWLGGAAIIVLVFGFIWPFLSTSLLSEDIRGSVLVQSIPFVAFFVCILLVFILLIFLVALRFNGKIPTRSYRGVEYIIISGIILSVVCLFQPWTIVPYRYGFILLVASTLGFILWSHVTPTSTSGEEDAGELTQPQRAVALVNGFVVGAVFYFSPVHGFIIVVASVVALILWIHWMPEDGELQAPRLTMRQQMVGAVLGLIVVLFLTLSAAAVNAPQPPYGLRQRIWDTYTPERQAAIASAATNSYQQVEVPFLLVFNLFPGCVVFFITRELAGGLNGRKEDKSVAAAVTAPENA
jgi:hypothetical protein